jgi:nucleotide-binding universal stress UspA family protein
MSETYIIGFDGSDASRAAVRFTTELAAATGASTTVANVYPEPPVVYGRGSLAGARDALTASSREESARLLATLEDVDVTEAVTVMSDSPAHGLQRAAQERDADLMAVGVTHRRGAARVAPGSVAEHLLFGAPCPVLVVPAGEGGRAVTSIGVAFDSRPEAQAALAHAVELAERLGARVTLISTVQPSLAAGAPGVPLSDSLEEPAREALEKVVQRAADELPPAVQASVRVVVGPPAQLDDEARAAGIDLLVCGSRGYGPMKSVLLGSVSRHLVDHARCPVLVVPRSSTPVADEPSMAHAAGTV